MTVKCEAIISGDGVYFSGQTVNGRICLSLDERILVKAMALKISGYAQTEWNSAKKPTDKPKIVNGREDFIATTTYLIGSEESTASVIIPEGSYTYSFSFGIPEKSPSSYERTSGYVRYQIKVILDYSNRTDEILTETLHVIRAFDLRPQALVLKLPLDLEVTESKSCCEFWKIPICLYVNLPQAGYVPGDTISVYARLVNEGNTPLRHLLVSLNQVVTYASRIPRELTLTERNTVVQVMSGITGKAALHEFLERLPIPSLPPTCDTDCKVLQVSYEVEAVAVPIKDASGVVVRIPVLIGTTPFADSGEQDDKRQIEINEKQNPDETECTKTESVIGSSSLDSAANISSSNVIMSAPPASSFQEAEFMSKANFSKEDKNSLNKDKTGFKPKYLYYEINENIEMTPTTMEMTKEITIDSKQ